MYAPNEQLETELDQLFDESGSDECDTPVGVLSSKFDKTDSSINTNPLLPGKYTLVGIDIDTTGRRLIDEIVQISAFTPERQYSQYIMPLMNLNPAARQRHQLRVITVGFFRMLKSMQTYRVVKSKSEISALNDFIAWLEQRRAEDEGSDGVVLIYHEQRKFVPYMVIEALKKYNLLDRFTATVKSFANGFKLAEEKCSKTIRYFSIQQLADIVQSDTEGENRVGFEGNAAYRACLAFEISRRLATTTETKQQTEGENSASPVTASADSTDADEPEIVELEEVENEDEEEELAKEEAKPEVEDKTEANEAASKSDEDEVKTTNERPCKGYRSQPLTEEDRQKMCTVICSFASPIDNEISAMHEQEEILVRQNSLRPVFLLYFKTTIYHRVKAVTYRRVLAESGHDYESLRQAWQDTKREGLVEIINKLPTLKDDERTELVELLDCHYDPEKQPVRPVVKRLRRRPSRAQPFFANKSNNVSRNVNNGNNGSFKENRKPGNQQQQQQQQQQHQQNGRHNANGHINKQQQQYNNGNNGNNNNQQSPPDGPRGGSEVTSPNKKYRQRPTRRRRINGNGGNGLPHQQQQKRMDNNNNNNVYQAQLQEA